MTKKTSKGKVSEIQQVYNKFLFDSHMDILRAEELQEKEIAELKRVFRLHGEAHMAQDLVPQFRELVKKVEKIEGVLNFKLNDGPIANHSKRIADLEETAEALSETVDQLSSVGPHTCHNIAALKDDRKRIMELEEIVEQLQISRSAEMLYHNDMIKRMDGLDNRLSRAQDMIAEMHKEGFIPVKQPQRKPMRSP